MSCAIPGVFRKSAKGTATLPSGVSGSAGIGGQNATREPGTDTSQILPDPSAGLADLDGYHASFTQDVTGTLDGKPYERHSQLELTRLNDAGQYDFTNIANGSDTADFRLRVMAQGNAFYRSMQDNPACREIKLPYLTFFDKEDQRLTVYINEGEKGSVDVDLLITFIEVIPASPQVEDTATPSGEPAPAATVNPGESGLPDDIPLYPGATDMLKTGEMVMFTVPDAPDVVAKYYSREMLANGWTMENETTFSDVSMQIWAKSGASITITVMVQDGSTNVVIILPE